MIRRTFSALAFLAVAVLLAVGASPLPAGAATLTDQEQLLERATLTVRLMRGGPDFAEIERILPRAKAVLIIPSLIKGAFIFGGEGGNGVLLARQRDGSWSNPAFYGLGNVSFGLQIGGQSSEIIFLIMSQQGLEAILDKNATLGADASVAIASMGKGVRASTGLDLNADMYAFAKTEGLFGGVALNGAGLGALSDWNHEFYRSEEATARNILINNRFPTPDPRAAALKAVLK
jgi:lipid-binding SYLF domain-containing protein